MFRLVCIVILVLIFGSLLIGGSRWLGQQFAVQTHDFHAYHLAIADAYSYRLYLEAQPYRLRIDLTDRPCFRDMMPVALSNTGGNNLIIVQDEVGFAITDVFTSARCDL